MILDILVFVSLLTVLYVYYGYGRILSFFCPSGTTLLESERSFDETELPVVTVLVAAFNEKDIIADRIDNILSCKYPHDNLEIVIASDGSDDGTDDIVECYQDERVKLFRTTGRQGKTETQNQAIQEICGDIVVFSDAGTRFDEQFLMEIVQPFSDQHVGAVDGHLSFVSDEAEGMAVSQGYYWKYELGLRESESALGILAVASGACLAVRKKLVRVMDPTIGEDCIVPLDVIEQGYRVVHCPTARAYDEMDKDGAGEFKARVRMTLRNWQGTWSRPKLLNPLSFPGIAFTLWSHKILRWLSPFFLVYVVITSLSSAILGFAIYQVMSAFIFAFMLFAWLGWNCEKHRRSCRMSSIVYSFSVANAGFFVGVLKALFGSRVSTYR